MYKKLWIAIFNQSAYNITNNTHPIPPLQSNIRQPTLLRKLPED